MIFELFPRSYRSALVASCLLLVFTSFTFASSIEGFVYDQNRNGLVDVDVELLNENGQLRGRTKTNGTGRYVFGNLADGWYFIKVLPFRYNLETAEERVRVDTLRVIPGIGNEVFQQDFFLKPRRGKLADTATGVVFVQDVPDEAEAHFEEAVKYLDEQKRDEGLKSLMKAVKAYPKYYAAWKKMGATLLTAKQPFEAAKAFIQAVQANPKSSYGFYFMGIAFSQSGDQYLNAALAAHKKAEELAGNDPAIPYEMGKIHRKLDNPSEAEVQLLKAKKLADGNTGVLSRIHQELTELYSNELKQYAKAAKELEAYMKVTDQKDNDSLRSQLERLKTKAKNQT